MRTIKDRKMSGMVKEWREFCIDESTRIIYLDDLE
jgi:hypothetical protein